MNHQGKTIIVSGASSGIGKAVAENFVKGGATVIANARRADKLDALAASLQDAAGELTGCTGDVTSDDDLQRLFAFSDAELNKPLDAFVLCAGHGLPGSLLTSDKSKWRQLCEVNYLAAMEQLRQCAELLIKQIKAGVAKPVQDIVVIGSTIGRNVSAFNPVYGSTKFALHSLVEGLRQELCEYNIRVTLIEPGFVRTEFQEVADYDMNWFNEMEAQIGPFLAPEDIAETVSFVVQQPSHVHVDNIRVRPTKQKV